MKKRHSGYLCSLASRPPSLRYPLHWFPILPLLFLLKLFGTFRVTNLDQLARTVQILKQKFPHPKNHLSPRQTRALATVGIAWAQRVGSLCYLVASSPVFPDVFTV